MEYKHFSHPHNLKIHQLHPHGKSGYCSGCETLISGPAYVCSSEDCSFWLHQDCGNAARGTQHASHPFHHLTLVPYTTYSSGIFSCKACGENGGKGFSYSCPLCDFDLHVRCALLPQVAAHKSHLHDLLLAYNSIPPTAFPRFNLPNQFVCGVCNKLMDGRFWSYNCYACDYHVHASCAMNEPKPDTDQTETVEPSLVTKSDLDTDKGEKTKSAGSNDACGKSQNELRTMPVQPEPSNGSGTGQSQPGNETVEDPEIRRRLELQQLQLQLDMNTALASMMGSFNLSSFV